MFFHSWHQQLIAERNSMNETIEELKLMNACRRKACSLQIQIQI